jgi:hypothetical protein
MALLMAAGAILALSTGVLAGQPAFVAKLKDTSCTHTGGVGNNGSLDTLAQMTENGRNGTNYMTIRGKFQERNSGSWKTLAGFGPYTSSTFPNNSVSYTHNQPFAWAFRDQDVGGTFRWKVTFQWWNQRSGPDEKLESKTKTTEGCTA